MCLLETFIADTDWLSQNLGERDSNMSPTIDPVSMRPNTRCAHDRGFNVVRTGIVSGQRWSVRVFVSESRFGPYEHRVASPVVDH